MAHESFEDPETAALMNANFINIKVDREERPDVDRIYMEALHSLGEQGGWPLTMFLTPEGEPFWGGTYFPPETRYGRPSFRHVLTEIARIWREERDKVTTNATALRAALTQPRQPGPSDELDPLLSEPGGNSLSRRRRFHPWRVSRRAQISARPGLRLPPRPIPAQRRAAPARGRHQDAHRNLPRRHL